MLASGIRIHPDLASRQHKHNLYDKYLLLCIQYQTPDDGQRNSLKHVEFYSKNKFEKLVHLVGFIISIYITMHGPLNVKFLCTVQTRPETHPACCTMGLVVFPEGKVGEAWHYHPPPSNAKLVNE